MSIMEAINFHSETKRLFNRVKGIDEPIVFKSEPLAQGRDKMRRILKKIQPSFFSLSEEVQHELVRRMMFMQSYDCWMRSKVICTFQDSFINVLRETKDTVFYPELLQKLPWNDFCIEIKGTQDRFKGYFVSIENSSKDKLEMAITLYQLVEKGNFIISYCSFFEIPKNKSLRSFITENIKQKDSNTICRVVDEMTTAISAIYYLAAENAEIKPAHSSSSNTFQTKENKTLKTKNYNVGFRIGASIEQMYQQGKEGESNSAAETSGTHPIAANLISTGKCTHIRRAHWHHFWTGKKNGTEERKLVVRWLAPTIVNGEPDEMDIVSHCVSEKENKQ